jgi:ubiquinone/menaquinone biosynthesis C-methylase UbiE
MAKQDEVEYFQNIGEEGRQHAANKPYSDPRCGAYFLDMGMIFSLLPPPPARILDLGVGTGWTSVFLANRGYSVVGQDISEGGIALAYENKFKAKLNNIDFVVSDYEHLNYENEFDGAVFYDCLHHSEDTALALASVYRALKPDGLCIAMEPGKGHASAEGSVSARKRWGVTEKDMPPAIIIELATRVGFRSNDIYVRIFEPIKMPRMRDVRAHIRAAKRFLCWFPLVGMNTSQIVVLRK